MRGVRRVKIVVDAGKVVPTFFSTELDIYYSACRLCGMSFSGPGENGAESLTQCVVHSHLVKEHGVTTAPEPVGEDAERVTCDKKCGAFEHPRTPNEYHATLTHYKTHAMWGGCSHANI